MGSSQLHEYIERLSNLLRAEARRSGSAYGLQPVQLEVLHYLAICNRYSNTPLAVAEYLDLTRGTVSQTLIVLENKKLISKQSDKRDRRVVHLKLSAAGRRLVEQAIPAPLLQAGCAHLSVKEKDAMVEALNKLLLACQQANQMKMFGICRTCRHNQNGIGAGYLCGLTQDLLSANDVKLICREHA